MLGAHVCTYLYCQLVSLGNALALQNAGTESTCKAVACSYSIGNFYLWSFLERLEAWSKDIAAVHTTGEHEHVEIVLTEDEPALVLDVKTGITEETAMVINSSSLIFNTSQRFKLSQITSLV